MTTEPALNSQLDLTHNERTVLDAAHTGLIALKKAFEHWTMIGRGLQVLRAKADRMGGRQTFDRLREQAGLGQQHLDKTVVSKLLRMMDELAVVQAWRVTLTEKERFEWASPSAVLKHCPVFSKPKAEDGDAEPAPSPMAKLKNAKADLEHENAHLKEQLAATSLRDGSLYDLHKSSAKDIFAVWRGKGVSRNKMKEFAALIRAYLKEQAPAG